MSPHVRVIKRYTLVSLLCLSILLSLVNLIQFCIFYTHRNIASYELLQRRKPSITILYALLSIINSLIILPTIIFTHLLEQQLVPSFLTPYITSSTPIGHHFIDNIWTFHFTHEVLTCLLLLIIFQRAWILFYDYKHIDAYANTEWKDIINPDESRHNKWLKHRKTCGSHTYLLKILFAFFIVIVSCLFVVRNILNLRHVWIVIDSLIAFPLCVLILYISCKIRNINDPFKVCKELQYLSIFIMIIVLSFAVLLVEHFVVHHTLHLHRKYARFIDVNIITFIADILYSYCTVHIQCYWVIKQTEHRGSSNLLGPRGLRRSSSRTRKMIQFIQDELGFKAFINHCVKEVNAENLLFLVEIAQYKATLLKYNVGEASIAHKFIDIHNENMHKMILDANTPEISPVTCTSMNHNSSGSNLSSKLNMALITERLRRGSEGGKQDDTEEDIFQGLHENILSQTWLPYARQLRPEKRPHKLAKSISISLIDIHIPRKGSRSKDVAIDIAPEDLPNTPHLRVTNSKVHVTSRSRSISPSRSHSNPDSEAIGPSSLRLVRRGSEYDDDDVDISKPKLNRSASAIERDKIKERKKFTVGNDWIFEYSMHLFNKYITNQAELSVNLPHTTRQQLINIFSLKMEDVFDNIWNYENAVLNDEQRKQLSSDKCRFRNTLIKTYLYHAFDTSWTNIWSLLRDDTFRRFQLTPEYIEINEMLNKRQPTPLPNKSRPSVSPKVSPKPSPRASPVGLSPNNSSGSRNNSRSVSPTDSPNQTPNLSPNHSPYLSSKRSSSKTSAFRLNTSLMQSTPINENEVYANVKYDEDADELVILDEEYLQSTKS
eukprot:54268_1